MTTAYRTSMTTNEQTGQAKWKKKKEKENYQQDETIDPINYLLYKWN